MIFAGDWWRRAVGGPRDFARKRAEVVGWRSARKVGVALTRCRGGGGRRHRDADRAAGHRRPGEDGYRGPKVATVRGRFRGAA